jgi:metallophosphoesterase superfamily enzyme
VDVESAKSERGDGIDDHSDPSGFVQQVLISALQFGHSTEWPANRDRSTAAAITIDTGHNHPQIKVRCDQVYLSQLARQK